MSIRIPKSQLKQIVKESIKEILKEGSNPDLRTFVKTCVQELMAEGKLNEIQIPQQIPMYQQGQQFINIPNQIPINNGYYTNQQMIPQQMNYGMIQQNPYDIQQQINLQHQKDQEHIKNVIKQSAQIIGGTSGKTNIFEKVLADTAATSVKQIVEFEKNGNKMPQEVERDQKAFQMFAKGKSERFKELVGNNNRSLLSKINFQD
jgi:hypothetical protein